MNQTRQEYITEQHQEMEAEGIKQDEYMYFNFDDEYYSLLEDHVKQGGTISQEVYNSLTQGQQYHFNKHYNFRGDKITNSDYSQAVEQIKKDNEEKQMVYRAELAQKRQEQELKEKQNTINSITIEINQLQLSLFDYNKLSPIGKRNNNKSEFEAKQQRIKQNIMELENSIKLLA